ncbi:related to arginine-tRNA-protein transferase [Rhynchosporium agropyri]|uniref:Related to arginine-tRNA-protein transferase n=1 Tax=Rhynchosporium agropyri TaxID=914238 RepID=A0A1E1KRQ8_9HELO|nr:related to arginine-tRNA-protein transferase [Rhynchosporium agropyri]
MQTEAPTAYSLLTPIGYSNGSCGYCGKKPGNSDQFHASKDQRQVQNRFTKNILGDTYIKEAARLYPRSREQAKKRNTDFDIVERVHECEKGQLKTPPVPAHDYNVTLESNEFTEEKYLLFENYQRVVHHEPPHKITKHGFKSFLCASPLLRSKEMFDGQERLLGSYHQCYRIDGKLVAVGVLDLLPQCVSAVYFMYHESVHQHGLGKLGALTEIALAKEQGYRWWYAGFYIHSCVKMRYKGDFSPQYILDPESYTWDPLDSEVKRRLDEKKYLSLSRERVGKAEERTVETEEQFTAIGTSNSVFENSDGEASLFDPDIPLFARSMPGILTKAQLQDDVDLDTMELLVRGTQAEAHQLVSWSTSDINDSHSVKCILAELAAAVGPKLVKEMRVEFG